MISGMGHSRYFLSDLHLLSSRSDGERFHREICQAARRTETLILGGDIFDFKWSTRDSFQRSVDAGMDWLKSLLKAGQDTKFHYLLGNHDAHPGFVQALEGLSQETGGQLEWHRHLLRIEESVFFHGDILDVGSCHRALDFRRAEKGEKICTNRVAHLAYHAAVNMKLHRAILPVVQPEKRVLKKLSSYLLEQKLGADQGVEQVFFGHTHRPMQGIFHNRQVFHNGGASIRGLDFRIVNADAERKPV